MSEFYEPDELEMNVNADNELHTENDVYDLFARADEVLEIIRGIIRYTPPPKDPIDLWIELDDEGDPEEEKKS